MSLYFRHLRVICWPKLPHMPALSLSLTHTLFLSLLLCSVAVFISCLCQLQIFFNFLAKIRYKLIALVAGKERRDVAEGAGQRGLRAPNEAKPWHTFWHTRRQFVGISCCLLVWVCARLSVCVCVCKYLKARQTMSMTFDTWPFFTHTHTKGDFRTHTHIHLANTITINI